jgi:UDP-glucose 4-epimerase
MHYLITGGCGFIGSHLVDRMLAQGDEITVLDNLSTGRIENLGDNLHHSRLHLLTGSVTDASLVDTAMQHCEAVIHLASAVGVRLIMSQPIESIDTMVLGTQVVLKAASRYRRPLLLTSTSEVYGKSQAIPFMEDGDRLEGPTTKHRWAYACAKALDEFMALAHWHTHRLPVIVVRLFNTVGPRQSAEYGMVIPNFVQRALAGEPLLIHGTGEQTRCFCHVSDVVRGLVQLINCPDAYGQVINIGSTQEISVRDLALHIISQLGSSSPLVTLPYQDVYGDGFEDMQRRVPSIAKIQQLIGWKPEKQLSDIIRDVAETVRQTSDSGSTCSRLDRKESGE